MSTLSFPLDTYKWLVSLQIIPNEGIINQKNLVVVAPTLAVHFESGFNIGQIVTKIIKKSGQKIPLCLQNVKPDNSKNAKLTNWNFVWLSFDDLRMQFDARIKDLILQGEMSLIVEIVKQLCDRDQNKDQKLIKSIVVKDRGQNNQKKKVVAGGDRGEMGKQSSLDIRKLNLQKDPDQAESSLEFLIILLSSSLNMSIEEILGLFTNQNKYLAHIIAKGVNDDFTGIILFYTLLNKHENKVRRLYEQNQKDAESMLYAIKPGFISKNQKVAELTIQTFSKVGHIYEWFTSEQGKGATTLLLGMKRHPQLVSHYWNLLAKIINNEEVEFFTTCFKRSFRDPFELIEICLIFFETLSESFLISKLNDIGIITEWLQIAVSLFEDPLEFKLMAYRFVGTVMTFYPQAFEQNEDSLVIFKKDWKDRKITDFVHLIDEVILILEKLTEFKNPMARKLYQIIIEILETVSLPGQQQEDKKQYLVQNFIEVLPKLPGIPSQYLIETYQENLLKSSDYLLIKQAIQTNHDPVGQARIGEVILRMYVSEPVVNIYLGPLIYQIALKVANEDAGHGFIRKAIKDCLHRYCSYEINKKPAAVVVPQPMYFNKKGNSKKVSHQDAENYTIKQKEAANLAQIVDRLAGLVVSNIEDPVYKSYIKDDLLGANSMIRQNNFKVGSKAISNTLHKRFHVTKEEQLNHDDDYKTRKSAEMEQSMARKKVNTLQNNSLLSIKKQGPEHLTKQFNDIIQKRKREEIEKKLQQERRARQDAYKKTLIMKQLQKVKLLKGFTGSQAEPKEQGFWNKFIKDEKELEIYPPDLMESRDLDYIDNIFKRYHRLVRSLFLKYTATMYTTKAINNFEDRQERTQTVSYVELIKFLKDYKLFFLTSSEDVKLLVKDINIKLLNRREVQDLDFHGFELFLTQFSVLFMVKPHTISVKTAKGGESVKKNYCHLSHCQLVQEFFIYLRQVFQEKGEKTVLFDEPQAAYFNETELIRDFNKKLEDDPGFILPEGYKKVTEKVFAFQPLLSEANSNLSEAYLDVYSVLDQILFQSPLKFHLFQPITKKTTKIRVKPQQFLNVKPKINQELGASKIRALSTVIQRKAPTIPPVKMLEKKTLSFGMKLGLSYVSYKDKLLGQQVAYVIDDMLDAVENNRTTIQKQKIMNDILRKRKQLEHQERKAQSQRQKKRKERKGQLQKIKKDVTEKKQKEQVENKQQNQKKKQKELSRQKKKKQDEKKYLEEMKKRMQQKKDKQQQQKVKGKQTSQQQKDQSKKSKDAFKDFNDKQLEKFKKSFEEDGLKRKKNVQLQQQDKKQKQELYKKLRTKIQSQDQKIKQIRQKTNEQIAELYHSEPIEKTFRLFQINLKAIYQFLIQNTYLSLTQRKHNNQIIFQTWQYFNLVFQLTPLIIEAKDNANIFKTLTKQKQVTKDYYIGLNYQEFQQALLRIAIKHKSVFNKLAEKIKEQKMSQKQINQIVQKDIQEKEKNEFDEPKQIDVKSLLKQEDQRKQVFDDYGDVLKTNEKTLKGLIYYLKVPKDKAGQEKRFREILASKIKSNVPTSERLREKLNQQYTLESPVKKRKSPKNNDSMGKSNNEQLNKSEGQEGQQQAAQ